MPITSNGIVGLSSSRQMLAQYGKLFAVTNPTPGTAVTYALKTGFSATANGLFSISNNNSSASGVHILLDRLKLIQTATAPTGTLVMRMEAYNENSIFAITTAAAARTPVNINLAYPNQTGAIVTSFSSGAGTVPAAGATRRLVGVGSLASGVTVQYDSFCFEFGADGPVFGKMGLTAARATDPADLVTWMPPVCIAPQTTSHLNLWWVTAAANTPDFEFELTYAEVGPLTPS